MNGLMISGCECARWSTECRHVCVMETGKGSENGIRDTIGHRGHGVGQMMRTRLMCNQID